MAPTDFPSETFAATRPHRPNVMATRHAVAGGHPWTVQAGFEILEAGGNAFDAGVAMGIATNVLESQFTSFSGVAPSLLYSAERREVVALSGVGVWPKAASVAYFPRQPRGPDRGDLERDRARRARHLAHGARRIRDHVLCRRRRRRHPLRPRRVPHVPLHGPHYRIQRRELPPLAVERRHLPAPGKAAGCRRDVRAGRSRRHPSVPGRRGERAPKRRPQGRNRGGAPGLLRRRRGDALRPLSRRQRRPSDPRRHGRIPHAPRAAEPHPHAGHRRLRGRPLLPRPLDAAGAGDPRRIRTCGHGPQLGRLRTHDHRGHQAGGRRP